MSNLRLYAFSNWLFNFHDEINVTTLLMLPLTFLIENVNLLIHKSPSRYWQCFLTAHDFSNRSLSYIGNTHIEFTCWHKYLCWRIFRIEQTRNGFHRNGRYTQLYTFTFCYHSIASASRAIEFSAGFSPLHDKFRSNNRSVHFRAGSHARCSLVQSK